MKIRELDLRAFGPFTERRLTFSAEAEGELHLIYGPNEAGKSSALRAINAALFGIETQTSDNFLHAYPDLRVGLSLERSDGEVLQFLRRKSPKQQLWDVSESKPIEEARLAQCLGGLDQAEFLRVFGLDHVRLRAGTERLLLAAEGTESAVVGAALGVRDLGDVQLQLRKEASELFLARARKTRINRTVIDWRDKKAELNQASLSTSAWKQAHRRVDQAIAARDEILKKEHDLQERLEEFEFVRRNRAGVKDWRALEEELGALEEILLLAPDFSERFHQAENDRREARRDRDRFVAEEKSLQERLGELPEAFPLCEQASRLEELRDEASAVGEAAKDRERLRARAEVCERAADAVAGTLGFPTPLNEEKVAELQLLMGAPADFCRELIKEHAGLKATLSDGAERLSDRQAELAAADQVLQGAGAAVDTSSLNAVRSAALRLGDPEAELARLREQLAQLTRSIDRDRTRLPGFSESAEVLLDRPLPGREVLEAFRARFQDLDVDERDAGVRRIDLAKSQASFEARLAALAQGEELLSLEALTEVRVRRDRLWELAKEAWLSAADNTEAGKALDAERSLPDALTFAIAQGDQISDRLRLESERVAEIAELRRQLDEVERLGQLLSDQEAALEVRAETLHQEWSDAWKDSGLSVGDWPTMQDVMLIREGLRTHLQERESCLFRIDELQGRIDAARAELCEVIASSGGDPPGPARSLADCLSIAAALGEELDAQAQEVREARIKSVEAKTALTRDQQAQEHRLRQLEDWRVQFVATTKDFPLRDEDPPESVEAVLRRMEGLLKERSQAADFRERMEKIDIRRGRLDSELDDFCRTYAPDLPDLDRPGTLARLFQVLDEQKAHRVEHERLSSDWLARKKAREAAERTLEAAESEMEFLTKEAAAESADDLPECIRKADAKRQVLEKRESLEKHFAGEEVSVPDLMARVEEMDAVDLSEEITPLRTELSEVTDRKAELVKEATLARADFKALEKDTGADGLALELAEIEAGLRDPFERYATLLFSSHMLSAAVESYREKNEAPLLGYASTFFSQLTRGGYDRIETDMDSRSQGGFRVRSASGTRSKPLSSLSQGTVDQLHLALVLGSLKHRFSAGAEPMPLLLDDILVHFDDDRSMAALDTLAEFSKTTQLLLFTHHERVREQALAAGGTVHDLLSA